MMARTVYRIVSERGTPLFGWYGPRAVPSFVGRMSRQPPTHFKSFVATSSFHLWRIDFQHAEVMEGPTHFNKGYELNWVERGRLEFACGDRVVSASEGGSILIPPGIENTPRGRSARVQQVTLPAARVEEAKDELGAGARLPHEGAALDIDARITRLLRLAVQEVEAGVGAEDPGLCSLVDTLAFALVRAPAEGKARDRLSPRIRRALAVIEAEHDAPLSIEDLANAAGMTRYAFMRAFRREVGRSAYQHLLQVRLDHAARRLRAGAGSVLEVALCSGFPDAGRFARAFRARFGMTPRDYLSAHDSPDRGSFRRDGARAGH